MTGQLQNIIDQQKIDIFCYIGDIQQMRTVMPVENTQDYIDRVFYSKVAQLSVPSYVIPGNTDFKNIVDNMTLKYKDSKMYINSNGMYITFDKFNIVMYPKVPYSNHCLKDFEAFEKYNQVNKQKMNHKQVFIKPCFDMNNTDHEYGEDGIFYEHKYFDVFKNFQSMPQQYKDRFINIYDDIENLIQKCNNNKPIILLTHAPPYNTFSDNISIKNPHHVGSRDIRKIIETENRIRINVSGHIHQSVLSNPHHEYQTQIQQDQNHICNCYTTGNSGIDTSLADNLCYIIIDTDTFTAQRYEIKLLNCQFQYTFERDLV